MGGMGWHGHRPGQWLRRVGDRPGHAGRHRTTRPRRRHPLAATGPPGSPGNRDHHPPHPHPRDGHGHGHGVRCVRAFTIDGRGFDPDRVDQAVAAGAVEEWTITNTSPMDHPFHLHVWPMQVVSIANTSIPAATWQNVVNVPARSSTVVRIAFDVYTGPHRLPLPHPRPRGQRHDGRHRRRLKPGESCPAGMRWAVGGSFSSTAPIG